MLLVSGWFPVLLVSGWFFVLLVSGWFLVALVSDWFLVLLVSDCSLVLLVFSNISDAISPSPMLRLGRASRHSYDKVKCKKQI